MCHFNSIFHKSICEIFKRKMSGLKKIIANSFNDFLFTLRIHKYKLEYTQTQTEYILIQTKPCRSINYNTFYKKQKLKSFFQIFFPLFLPPSLLRNVRSHPLITSSNFFNCVCFSNQFYLTDTIKTKTNKQQQQQQQQQQNITLNFWEE